MERQAVSLLTKVISQNSITKTRIPNVNAALAGVLSRTCHSGTDTQLSPEESLLELCKNPVKEMRGDGRYTQPEEPVFPKIKVPHLIFINHPRKLLDFSTTDYLGFSANKRAISAYNKALVESTHGPTVRHVEGVMIDTLQLEEDIANFFGYESCLTFNNPSEVITGIFCSLYCENDVIFMDEVTALRVGNAAKVTGATLKVYSHLDLEDLETQLSSIKIQNDGRKVIFFDAIIPYTGHGGSIGRLIDLARRTSSHLIIDDSCCTGILGESVRGSEVLASVKDVPLLVLSSLENGFGQNSGGFVVGNEDLITYLTSTIPLHQEIIDLSMPIVAATTEVLQQLPTQKNAAYDLREKSQYTREKLRLYGVHTKGTDHPTISIEFKSHRIANKCTEQLKDAGIYCLNVRYPWCLQGKTKVVVTLTANHTEEHISTLIKAISGVAERLKMKR